MTVLELVRNVAYAGTGLLGSGALGILVLVIVARTLGVEEFGVYGFAVNYVSLWSVVMDGGGVMIATREVARRDGAVALRALFTLKPALLLIALAGVTLGAWAGGLAPAVQRVVLLQGLGAAAAACLALALAVFRGFEEFGTESAHLVTQRLLFGLLAVAALVAQAGAAGVALASACSWALLLVPALWLLRRRHGVTWALDPAAVREHGGSVLRSAAPLVLADALTQLHIRNGPVILQLAQGGPAVGLYIAARRLIEGLHLVPSAVGVALFPRFVAAWKESAQEGAVRLRVTLRFMGTVALAVLIAGWLWAEEGVGLLFGSAYAPAGALVRIMLGALVFMMLNSVLTLTLIAMGRERGYAGALGVAAGVSVIFNLSLVRLLGAAAPAWSSLLSEAVLFGGCLLMLRREVKGFLPLAHWAILLAGVVVALAALTAVKQASPVVALVLTLAVVLGGFEVMSPIGFLQVLRQLGAQREFRRGRDL
ncbi:MAG: oligosaccharide flippase family protein [Candidatus Rokubacteria bacterium]|nr:oligosaccharide flippase family protein [Candidatus Rokubacteria bacterium]